MFSKLQSATLVVAPFAGGGNAIGGTGGGGGGRFFLACIFLSADQLAHTGYTLFSLLSQDQSTMAQRAETTVAKCFMTSCARARFF